MASGIRFVTQRTGDGAGQPVLDSENGEELMHVQPGVSIVLGDGHRPPESPGTLYITTKQVVWLSDTDRARGYAVDFISVSLHAVSRDPEAYPSPCIYTQIETGTEEDELEDSDSESDDALIISKITEMRLVPSDPNQLHTLFAIFCECAELNPDPTEGDDEYHYNKNTECFPLLFSATSYFVMLPVEEEGEHNWVFSADQLEYDATEGEDPEWAVSQNSIGANGNLDLAHSVVQLQINDRRFEDAEEMEQDDKNSHQ